MDKKKDLYNILDECLDRVMNGEDIMAVLAMYPQHARELEPLLRTAMAARDAATVKPRPEFRQQAAVDFQKAIREMPVKAPAGRGFRWQFAWMTPLAVFLVLLIAGSGTVAAAGNSLPDSPLYSVKLAAESVQLALTPSALGKAELYSKFNDRRIDELVRMSEEGKTGQVEKITRNMASNMAAMNELTAGEETMLASYSVGDATESDAAPPAVQQKGLAPSAAAPEPQPSDEVFEAPGQGPVAHDERNQAQRNQNDKGNQNSRNQRLQEILTERQQKALEKLRQELENAPEWLKPEIQKAIDIILGYDETINNLDY